MIDKKLSLKPYPPIAAMYTETISNTFGPFTVVIPQQYVTDPSLTTHTTNVTYTITPTLSGPAILLTPSEEPSATSLSPTNPEQPSIESGTASPFNTSLPMPMVSSRAEPPVADSTFTYLTTITMRPTGMVSSRDEPTPITFTVNPSLTITFYPLPPTATPFAKRGDRGYYIMDWLKSMQCNMKDPHQMQMAKFLHAFMFNSADI